MRCTTHAGSCCAAMGGQSTADAGLLHRLEPLGFLRALVDAAADDDQHRVITVDGRGVVGERFRADIAGLAGGDAQLDHLFLGEQRHRAATGDDLPPVEAGFLRESNALGVALRARLAANLVQRFFDEQGLAAEQQIQRR